MDNIFAILQRLNDRISGVVWGVPMLVLMFATGLYFTVRTGFFQITRIRLITRQTFLAIFKKPSVTKSGDKKAISQFQALSTALAATLGTGNIAGVATAITVGGPGAVFWMWVSAFFGMMTGFSENVLGIYYRQKNKNGEWAGGAMYYLQAGLQSKKILRRFAKPLAVLFAAFCALASFGIGNMTQINTISTALKSAFEPMNGYPLSPLSIGIVLAALIGMVILGGIQRIGRVTEKVVPVMACLYTLGACIIFIMNIQNAPAVFASIFRGAFGLGAVSGGVAGAIIKQAVTMGFKRGVFSNEAGLGSSVVVHAASDIKEPVEQGMWSIFEVFFDTILMCTLTAFAVLSTGIVDLNTGTVATGMEGAALVTAAFSKNFHAWAGVFVAVSTLFFAFSTILGWSFYGAKCVEYLFGIKGVLPYKILFVGFIVVGATMRLDLAWEVSDTLNGLMAIPNLIGVLALSGTVLRITRNYIDRRIRGKQYIRPLLSYDVRIQEQQENKLIAEAAREMQ